MEVNSNKKWKLTKEVIQIIKECKAEGAPMRVIVQETGVKESTLYLYFKEASDMAEQVQNDTFDFSKIDYKKKPYYYHLAELHKAIAEGEKEFQRRLRDEFRALMAEGEADEQISDNPIS